MRIKNEFAEKVFWRAFKGDDTVYAVGLAEGTIQSGQTASWRDDSFSSVKVEIKKGNDIFAAFLSRAGQQFRMTDDLVVDSTGHLDVAKPKLNGGKAGHPALQKDVKFVDMRKFDQPMTREIGFSIQNAFSTSEGLNQSHEHSQTWSVEGKLAGNIGHTPKESEGGLGGGGSAEVSVGFVDAVVDSLQNAYSKQVESVWSTTVTDTFTFAPGGLYVVEVDWCVNLEEGTVSYYGEQTSYSVVKSADGSLTTPAKYDKVEDMPPYLQEKFKAFRN